MVAARWFMSFPPFGKSCQAFVETASVAVYPVDREQAICVCLGDRAIFRQFRDNRKPHASTIGVHIVLANPRSIDHDTDWSLERLDQLHR